MRQLDFLSTNFYSTVEQQGNECVGKSGLLKSKDFCRVNKSVLIGNSKIMSFKESGLLFCTRTTKSSVPFFENILQNIYNLYIFLKSDLFLSPR